jgi:hypothetical protein
MLFASKSGSENLYYVDTLMDVSISKEVLDSIPDECRKKPACLINQHFKSFPYPSFDSFFAATDSWWKKDASLVPKKYKETEAGLDLQYTFQGYYISDRPLDSMLAIKRIDTQAAFAFRDFSKGSKACSGSKAWESNLYYIFSEFRHSNECTADLQKSVSGLFVSHPIRSTLIEAANPSAVPNYDKMISDNKLNVLSLNFRLDYNWDEPRKGISQDHIAKISQETREEVERLTGSKFRETSPSSDKFRIDALDYSLSAEIKVGSKPAQIEFREILFESGFEDPAWKSISKDLGAYDIVIANGHGFTTPEKIIKAIETLPTRPKLVLLNGCYTLSTLVRQKIDARNTDYVVIAGLSPFHSFSLYTTVLMKSILKAEKYRDYLKTLDIESQNIIRKAKILEEAGPAAKPTPSPDDWISEIPKPPLVYVISRESRSP